MKIKINEVFRKTFFNKEVIGYRADFTELPGSPTVGTGKTKEDAVATLFIRNLEHLNKLDSYLTVTNENGEKAPFTTTFSEDVFNKIFKEITIHGR